MDKRIYEPHLKNFYKQLYTDPFLKNDIGATISCIVPVYGNTPAILICSNTHTKDVIKNYSIDYIRLKRIIFITLSYKYFKHLKLNYSIVSVIKNYIIK